MPKQDNKGMFVKGGKGGPGRPKQAFDLRKAKQAKRTLVETTLARYLDMPVAELKSVLINQKLPVLDHIVARVSLMAIKEGDADRLRFILDRLIGKIPSEDRDIPFVDVLGGSGQKQASNG